MRGRRHPTGVRARAVALRQQGHSLREISDTLYVSKITVQGWVAHVSLTEAQCQQIREKEIISAARGRPLAVEAWRKKIAIWKEGIYHQVQHLGWLPFEQAAIGQLTCGLLYLRGRQVSGDAGSFLCEYRSTHDQTIPHVVAAALPSSGGEIPSSDHASVGSRRGATQTVLVSGHGHFAHPMLSYLC